MERLPLSHLFSPDVWLARGKSIPRWMILTEKHRDFPAVKGPSADIRLSAVTRYLWQGHWGQNTGIDPVNIDGPNGTEDEWNCLPLEM